MYSTENMSEKGYAPKISKMASRFNKSFGCIWRFPNMGVPPPSHLSLIGFSSTKPSILAKPISGNHHLGHDYDCFCLDQQSK